MGENKILGRLFRWDDIACDNLSTYDSIHTLYSLHGDNSVYNILSASKIRAGMVVINQNDMLLVRQREFVCVERGVMRKFQSNRGPPKGLSERRDYSALDTAERELFEETGIDVHDSRLNTQLLPAAFICPRDGHNYEIIIYFVVRVSNRPEIVYDDEIIGHDWVDMGKLKEIRDVSLPTKNLLSKLNTMDFASATSWVDIPSV